VDTVAIVVHQARGRQLDEAYEYFFVFLRNDRTAIQQ
jgi:hypothetical protein